MRDLLDEAIPPVTFRTYVEAGLLAAAAAVGLGSAILSVVRWLLGLCS